MYTDIIESKDDQPDSASNPIPIDSNEQTVSDKKIHTPIPSDKRTPIFTIQSPKNSANASDSSSTDTISLSSTDQSLREALNSFNELEDLDSELFNAELESFIEEEKN